MMEGWRQQTITKHPDTRGSFASGIRPQHRPWGAVHRSLGISVYPPDITYPEEVWAPVVVAVESA